MKNSLFLIFIALAMSLASAESFDEESGKPTCSTKNLNLKFPVKCFQDAYWICRSAGAEAEFKRCPLNTLFDAVDKECEPIKSYNYSHYQRCT